MVVEGVVVYKVVGWPVRILSVRAVAGNPSCCPNFPSHGQMGSAGGAQVQ